MKNRLIASLVAGLLVLSVTVFAGYETLFESIRSSAWAIYLRSAGGLSASCSAIAFKSNSEKTYLLSAGHCFLGADLKRTDFMVTQDHRTFYRADLYVSGLTPRKNTAGTSVDLDAYEGDDWAVVVADVGHRATAPLGDSKQLKIGEDLIVVGVPFGLDFLAVQGILGSTDVSLSQLVWNHYYGANIYVAGGNSGSGVISTKQKAIVGVVNAGPGSQSSMMIFLPIHRIPVEKLP